MPSASSNAMDADDMLVPGGRGNPPKKNKDKRKGVETFGAGMEKGHEETSAGLTDSDRQGRTQRRRGVRSGSKNVFRKMDG